MSTPKTDDGVHISQEFREEHRDRDHPPTADEEREQAEARKDRAKAIADEVERSDRSPHNRMITDTVTPERAPVLRRACS